MVARATEMTTEVWTGSLPGVPWAGPAAADRKRTTAPATDRVELVMITLAAGDETKKRSKNLTSGDEAEANL